MRFQQAGFLLLASLTFYGCLDEGVSTTEPAFSVQSAEAINTGRFVTRDEQLALMARAVPGFAGVYRDDGQLVVLMQEDGADLETVRVAVRQLLRDQAQGSEEFVEARARLADDLRREPVTYDFNQLFSWQRLMRATLPTGAYKWTDIEVADNRIEIAVPSADVVDTYRAALVRAGIPEDAFVVLVDPTEIRTAANLRSTVSPRVGGIKIDRKILFSPSQECTLGFNVPGPSDFYWYFVTASHCTGQVGSDTNEKMYQPDTTGTHIGTEHSDPPTFTNSADPDCPSGEDCRYSDAALFRYVGGSYSYGEYAKPSSVDWTWPSHESTTFSNTSRIGGALDPLEGDTVYMVGAKSGRTGGVVTDDCIEVAPVDIDVTFVCNMAADYPGRRGDSGGPVIHRHHPYVLIYPDYAAGIMIAVNESSSLSYFSPTSNWQDEIDDDLSGSYCPSVFCAPNPNASITSGPTILPSGLYCTWTASASGGVPPYSYAWSGVASGGGSSLDAIVNSSGYLTVTVTDDVGHQDTASWYITIDNGASAPPGCSE